MTAKIYSKASSAALERDISAKGDKHYSEAEAVAEKTIITFEVPSSNFRIVSRNKKALFTRGIVIMGSICRHGSIDLVETGKSVIKNSYP